MPLVHRGPEPTLARALRDPPPTPQGWCCPSPLALLESLQELSALGLPPSLLGPCWPDTPTSSSLLPQHPVLSQKPPQHTHTHQQLFASRGHLDTPLPEVTHLIPEAHSTSQQGLVCPRPLGPSWSRECVLAVWHSLGSVCPQEAGPARRGLRWNRSCDRRQLVSSDRRSVGATAPVIISAVSAELRAVSAPGRSWPAPPHWAACLESASLDPQRGAEGSQGHGSSHCHSRLDWSWR